MIKISISPDECLILRNTIERTLVCKNTRHYGSNYSNNFGPHGFIR